MLSVTAETAVYSQQALLRTRGSTDDASAPTTGFSSLVDSNTDAATANRDESSRRPDNQTEPARGDDSNSAPPADAANSKGKTPLARGETNAASNSDGNAKTTDTTDRQQQPADASATTDPSVNAGASTAEAQADAAAQYVASRGKGKATTKSDATADSTTADAAQSMPVDEATTLVVAVVAEVTSPAPVSATTPNSDYSPSAVTATTAASSVPGAIAAAAASKVAADVAATELTATAPSDAAVVHGTSADAKAAATDPAQAIITGQQPAPQPTDPTTGQASTAHVVPDDAIALVQAAAAAAQTTAPVNVAPPSVPTAKNSKAASIAADAKITATQNERSAALDPQVTKVAATDDAKSALDPIAQKKSGGSAQARDTPDEILAKTQPGTDAPAALTVHQHESIEPRVAQQSALGVPDLSNSNAAQSAANAATTAAPAPVATTALDTSNLTVMTGQAVPLSGLAVEISANAKAGNSRFEIRLDPPDLGRIDVRLDVDRNGQVTSRLFVEKSETLDLLRRDAPQLQQALQDAGLKTGDSGLQFSLRDQNQQQGQSNSNGSGQNTQRLVVVEDDTVATASAAGRSYGRSLNASGGVDIRV